MEGEKKPFPSLAPVAKDRQFAAMFNSRAKSCCASNPSLVLKHTSSAEYQACMMLKQRKYVPTWVYVWYKPVKLYVSIIA